MKQSLFTFSLVLALAAPAFASNQPYSGQQLRTIKSMSAGDVEGHIQGYGLGYAKTAELNHYPGPAHLRELTQELGLSEDVLQEIIAIEDDMRQKAIQLGREIVDMERQLDMMFAHAQAAPDLVTRLSKKIGTLQGELRAVHLNAHLAVRPLLSDDIVKRYDELRGYMQGTEETFSEHNQHHGH